MEKIGEKATSAYWVIFNEFGQVSEEILFVSRILGFLIQFEILCQACV